MKKTEPELKISIVTICYNVGESIKLTAESIVNQEYQNY